MERTEVLDHVGDDLIASVWSVRTDVDPRALAMDALHQLEAADTGSGGIDSIIRALALDSLHQLAKTLLDAKKARTDAPDPPNPHSPRMKLRLVK